MKAVVQDGYGGVDALRVGEVEIPTPGPGEVLVRVMATSVHADVWHVVCGLPRILRVMGTGLMAPKNQVPGTDMAGVVEALGEGVAAFSPGDEVFGETIGAMQWVNGGAWAEYVCAPAQCLARKPDSVTFAQAASVPTAGYIVYLNLDGGALPRRRRCS